MELKKPDLPAPPGADVYDPVSQPYGGPYPTGVDLTAGGADSSPFETMSSEERHAVAKEEKEMGRSPASQPAGPPDRGDEPRGS